MDALSAIRGWAENPCTVRVCDVAARSGNDKREKSSDPIRRSTASDFPVKMYFCRLPRSLQNPVCAEFAMEAKELRQKPASFYFDTHQTVEVSNAHRLG
jgi:hypothetical protein